APSLGFHGVR
uniref:Locustatachykinin-4 n=1 Tax=Locusta migratoria TaxID=7004 RepID=TKL4_LOCMI|nr:RecName: Full=Locustatachykinin-4; AltName: Full=Locustatachykinin IV; Short=TK-IV [Locusta migratoria]